MKFIRLVLAALIIIVFAVPAYSADCNVDWGTTHQSIRGFGASSAWSGTTMPTALADLFFRTDASNIGLSIYRTRIPPDGTMTGEIGSGSWDNSVSREAKPVTTWPTICLAHRPTIRRVPCRYWMAGTKKPRSPLPPPAPFLIPPSTFRLPPSAFLRTKTSKIVRTLVFRFEPEVWKPNYPNPAFIRRQSDDEYWAASIVMAFTEQDIRALVETGRYSDPQVIDYLTRTLVQRRNKIGKTYFSKVLPLDLFQVIDGELQFQDLAVKYSLRPALHYQVEWSRFDNDTNKLTPLEGEISFRLPRALVRSEDGSYFAAAIQAQGDQRKTVTAYLRKHHNMVEIVGIDRTWSGCRPSAGATGR